LRRRRGPKTLEENEFNRALGARVAQFRRNRRITQGQLAWSARVSDAQMGYYESGESRIPPLRLLRISKRLRVEIEELLPDTK
jgi:transcriptional regulator with XRE-family HTH domain